MTTTWNPSDKAASIVLSNGNLTAAATGGSEQQLVRSTASHSTGKVYFECQAVNTSDNAIVGFADSSEITLQSPGGGPHSAGWVSSIGIVVNSTTLVSGTYPVNSIIGVAIDIPNKLFWMRIAPVGLWNLSGTADPATGVGGLSIPSLTGNVFIASGGRNSGATTINAGDNGAFSGAIPVGFSAFTPPAPSQSAITAFHIESVLSSGSALAEISSFHIEVSLVQIPAPGPPPPGTVGGNNFFVMA